MPIVVLDIHSSHTNTMYTVIFRERLHAFNVCFEAVKKADMATPRESPQMMLDSSMSPLLGLSDN